MTDDMIDKKCGSVLKELMLIMRFIVELRMEMIDEY